MVPMRFMLAWFISTPSTRGQCRAQTSPPSSKFHFGGGDHDNAHSQKEDGILDVFFVHICTLFLVVLLYTELRT